MTTRTIALAMLVVASSAASPLGAQATLPRWMAGCWSRHAGASLITEQWSLPRANMMLGIGQTTRGDSTIEWEHTRIYVRGARLVYDARPSGQAPAEFVAEPNDTLLVFSNPAHDFPQRVIYRRRGADSLLARIEGTRAAVSKGIDFPYARTACE